MGAMQVNRLWSSPSRLCFFSCCCSGFNVCVAFMCVCVEPARCYSNADSCHIFITQLFPLGAFGFLYLWLLGSSAAVNPPFSNILFLSVWWTYSRRCCAHEHGSFSLRRLNGNRTPHKGGGLKIKVSRTMTDYSSLMVEKISG